MRVPTYIKEKIKRAASLYRKARECMGEIERFFKAQRLNVEKMRDGSGGGLDEVEYGNEPTAEFFADIENGVFDEKEGGI